MSTVECDIPIDGLDKVTQLIPMGSVKRTQSRRHNASGRMFARMVKVFNSIRKKDLYYIRTTHEGKGGGSNKANIIS